MTDDERALHERFPNRFLIGVSIGFVLIALALSALQPGYDPTVRDRGATNFQILSGQ